MLAFTITTIGAEDLHSCQNAPSHFNKIKITYTHLPKTVVQSDHLSEYHFFLTLFLQNRTS